MYPTRAATTKRTITTSAKAVTATATAYADATTTTTTTTAVITTICKYFKLGFRAIELIE